MGQNDARNFLASLFIVVVIAIAGLLVLFDLNEPEELTIEQLQPIVKAWVAENQQVLTEDIVRAAEQYIDGEGLEEKVNDQLRWHTTPVKGKASVTVTYEEDRLSIAQTYELTIRDRKVVRWSQVSGSSSYVH